MNLSNYGSGLMYNRKILELVKDEVYEEVEMNCVTIRDKKLNLLSSPLPPTLQ